jgi:hypothetical protein
MGNLAPEEKTATKQRFVCAGRFGRRSSKTNAHRCRTCAPGRRGEGGEQCLPLSQAEHAYNDIGL